LQDKGYNLELREGGLLLVKDVPYVTERIEVKWGVLISQLNLAGNCTQYVKGTGSLHTVLWQGEAPCRANGQRLGFVDGGPNSHRVREDLTAQYQFSSKPPGDYDDYFHKMDTYIGLISGPATELEGATAQSWPVVPLTDEESVFKYADTASTRAGIAHLSGKLKKGKVGIIGAGGTASYILDFLCKTPVPEIHLYDGDRFFTHNAFRAPGAPSLEELEEPPLKVEYLTKKYSEMRRGIVPHPYYVTKENVAELEQFEFVFIAMDKAGQKRPILEALQTFGIPFADVGMDLHRAEDDSPIGGGMRVTTSSKEKSSHVWEYGRIPIADGEAAGKVNEYVTNIQVAELNAMNAALAVIKWKKMLGYYADFRHEHFTAFSLESNAMVNQDCPSSDDE
jgi:hypothetical protein